MRILLLSAVILLFGCKAEKPPMENAPTMALNIGDPMDCGIQNTLLFPVGSVNSNTNDALDLNIKFNGFTVNQSSLRDRWANVEYINAYRGQIDIHNILFYNPLDSTSYALTDDTLSILSFAIHQEFEAPLIFYRVVKADHNSDGMLNESDAVHLYCSTPDGKNFTQITPDDESFIDYFYYPEQQTILCKTLIDHNADATFDALDETNFRSVNLQSPNMSEALFDDELKDGLRI